MIELKIVIVDTNCNLCKEIINFLKTKDNVKIEYYNYYKVMAVFDGLDIKPVSPIYIFKKSDDNKLKRIDFLSIIKKINDGKN